MEPSHTPTDRQTWPHFVLASRSPRRRELLASLAPTARIEIVPPPSTEEPGFHDCHTWSAIEHQITAIARSKSDAVHALCATRTDRAQAVLIAADTEIVVDDGTGRLQVLGQPPEAETWRDVVRDWFTRFYSGRPHWAVSALCVRFPDGRTVESRTRTEVEFRSDVLHWLPWYLDTGESRGKAGGYAIQGAGSVFVARVTGSLSNVVGLPLESLLSALEGTPR